MSQTTALKCMGDDRKPGCGATIGLFERGAVVRAGDGELISVDRLGRARMLCLCGAITITKGHAVTTG